MGDFRESTSLRNSSRTHLAYFITSLVSECLPASEHGPCLWHRLFCLGSGLGTKQAFLTSWECNGEFWGSCIFGLFLTQLVFFMGQNVNEYNLAKWKSEWRVKLEPWGAPPWGGRKGVIYNLSWPHSLDFLQWPKFKIICLMNYIKNWKW